MADSLIEIFSDYDYVAGQITGNALAFQAKFMSDEWMISEVYNISRSLEMTAKAFADAYTEGATGNLVSNIKSDVLFKGEYYNIVLGSYAKDKKGAFYGGHVEYGHKTRNGKSFVQARPYMRPALQIVSETSMSGMAAGVGQILNKYLSASGAMMESHTLGFGHRSAISNPGVTGLSKGMRAQHISKHTRVSEAVSKKLETKQGRSALSRLRGEYSIQRGKTAINSKGVHNWNTRTGVSKYRGEDASNRINKQYEQISKYSAPRPNTKAGAVTKSGNSYNVRTHTGEKMSYKGSAYLGNRNTRSVANEYRQIRNDRQKYNEKFFKEEGIKDD